MTTTTTQPAVLDRVRTLLTDQYVFPDVAEAIAASLADLALDGLGPDETAALLTTRLQAVNHDRHLRVRRRTGEGADAAADRDAEEAAHALRSAGGVRTVTRLDERTGLLAITPYTAIVDLAEPYVVAAFTLLRGVERLVIDLREGHGGFPDTIALICGYLLGPEPVHLQDLVGRDGTVQQFWTRPAAGRLPDEVAVRVLTSSATFSGCEELAYNLQTRRRGTVVGERTGGGAHPVEVFDLDGTLEVAIPVARSVNAVTGINWEQVGVAPDLPCPAAEALDRALADLARADLA